LFALCFSEIIEDAMRRDTAAPPHFIQDISHGACLAIGTRVLVMFLDLFDLFESW